MKLAPGAPFPPDLPRVSAPARIVCGILGVDLIATAVWLTVGEVLAGDFTAILLGAMAVVIGAWLTHLAAKGEYSASSSARSHDGAAGVHLGRGARWFCGVSGAAVLVLLGWTMLHGDFDQEVLLVAVVIGVGLLVAAFTGIDPTKDDDVIPPASERFLELSDPKRAIDAEAMTSGSPRADASRETVPARPAPDGGSPRSQK